MAYLSSAFRPASARLPSRGMLRLGIISSDLTEHIVGHGIAALLAALDASRVQVYTYPLTADDGSKSRNSIRSLSTLTDVTGWSAEAVARRINGDLLHALVDLNGHTKGNMMDILALRYVLCS